MGRLANDAHEASLVLPETSGLTVREVLDLPALAGARLVAGIAGADRVVERLNVMEVPDILPWVKPHELLLTTGYPLRDHVDTLPDLIAALDERGLAAVAIKPRRYLDELPGAMLAEADRRSFPIIELPATAGFDDVLNQVLTEVLNRQAAVLARAEEVHRALVSVVLDGGGLSELVAELAGIVAGPVLVTSPDGRVFAQVGETAELEQAAHPACFDGTGRFRTEAEPPGLRRHGAGWHAVVPIIAGRVDHGRIVAFAGTRPLDHADVRALERAATVAALVITKQLAVNAVEVKYRADFLRDVLTGRLDDIESAVEHCAAFGWDIDRPVVVVVAELDPVETEETPAPSHPFERRPVLERFTAAWQTVVQQVDAAAPVVGFNQEVVVVLGIPDGAPATLERRIRDLVRRVAGDGGGGRRSFSAGVSRVAEKAGWLAEAYEQARKAARVGRRTQGRGAVAHFDALGVHRLLSQIPDADELRTFVGETLRALAADADPEMADLRRTLAVLLETNLNVAETARRLHFHYNTLRYRIIKLERLVGPFTSDPELRLNIGVALRAMEIRDL